MRFCPTIWFSFVTWLKLHLPKESQMTWNPRKRKTSTNKSCFSDAHNYVIWLTRKMRLWKKKRTNWDFLSIQKNGNWPRKKRNKIKRNRKIDQKCIIYTLTQCLKIAKKVSFKIVNFANFLKTWNLRSNSVNRHVNFNWTKIEWKCRNWKFQKRHF